MPPPEHLSHPLFANRGQTRARSPPWLLPRISEVPRYVEFLFTFNVFSPILKFNTMSGVQLGK